MLKLSNFPRGSNRNRPLKLRAIALQEEDDGHNLQETRRLFKRFWRERDRNATGDPRQGT